MFVHVGTRIVGATRHTLNAHALGWSGDGVSKAAASRSVACQPGVVRWHDHVVVAQRARLGRGARGPDVHTQRDLRIGHEVDLPKAAAHAIAGRIGRRVHRHVDNLKIQVDGVPVAGVVHLGHVDISDTAWRRGVWPEATQVREAELRVVEVEIEALTDAWYKR